MKHKIEYIELGNLIPYARNSRTHEQSQIAQIADSIKEFGFTNPVLIDEDNIIIAGHGRVLAADKLKLDTVPCIRLSGMNESQKRAYVIADNRLALNAGWDFDMLAVEIDELQESGFCVNLLGFTQEELNELVGTPNEPPNKNDAEKIPEKPSVAITKIGDVWVLGKHRLYCGDSTSISTADKILCGVIPDLCLYDPPYDMDNAWSHSYPAKKIAALHDFKNVIGAVEALQGKPIVYQFIWDCGACWWTPNRPLARHKACLIGMDDPLWMVDDATYVDGKTRKAKTVSNTRGECDYEPLPGGAVRMSTVFMRPTSQEDGGHVHSKPVDWIRAMIAGTGAKSVLDQFAGSGTGIIACEQLGIPCFSVELSDIQCDVIVKRWEDYTGKKAELQK